MFFHMWRTLLWVFDVTTNQTKLKDLQQIYFYPVEHDVDRLVICFFLQQQVKYLHFSKVVK